MIQNRDKMRADTRTFVLSPLEGAAKNSIGMVDTRLFSGDNVLYAVRDAQYSTWTLQYKHGVLPAPFKQTFTSFKKLEKYVADYMNRRNVRIVKVLD